jgi:hypothetical protein
LDASSGGILVRVAALRGIAFVADNVLSHQLLSALLLSPSNEHIGRSIFHRSDSVVLALVSLLVLLKTQRTLPEFYKVCKTEHLILALEQSNSPKVQHAIVSLLASNFMPKKMKAKKAGQGSAEELSQLHAARSLSLLKTHDAARSFLLLLGSLRHLEQTEGVTLESRIGLFKALWNAAVSNANKQREAFISRKTEDEEEQEEEKKSEEADAGDHQEENATEGKKKRKKSAVAPSKKSRVSESSLSVAERSDPLFLDASRVVHWEALLSGIVLLLRDVLEDIKALDENANSKPRRSNRTRKNADEDMKDAEENNDDDEQDEEEPRQQHREGDAERLLAEVAECFETPAAGAAEAMDGLSLLLATIGSRSAPARLSLLHLAALMPESSDDSDACADLRALSFPHLLELAPFVGRGNRIPTPQSEFGPLLECVCSWGRLDALLLHIHRAIAMGLQYAEGYFDAHSEEERRNMAQLWMEEWRAAHTQAEAGKKKAKGKNNKKNNAAAAAVFDDEEASSGVVLHPIMALRYLAYLMEHDKTRSAVLASAVEWRAAEAVPSSEVGASDDAATAPAPAGAIALVGPLAEILAMFSADLLPQLQRVVESGSSSSSSASSCASQSIHMTFLHLALDLSLKSNLHVHARMKLLATRAHEVALEEFAARCGGGGAATSDVEPAPVLIEMFPMDLEATMDFALFAILPKWDEIVATKEEQEEEEEEEEKKNGTREPRAEEQEESQAKSKKQKQQSTEAAGSAPVPALSPHFISSVRSFVLELSSTLTKFAVELSTIGYFHPRVTLRLVEAFLDANLHCFADASKQAGGRINDLQARWIGERMLPHAHKLFFQLCAIAGSTPSFFGVKDQNDKAYQRNERELTFAQLDTFTKKLNKITAAFLAQTQPAASPATQSADASYAGDEAAFSSALSSWTQCLGEGIKSLPAFAASSKQRRRANPVAKVVSSALRTIVAPHGLEASLALPLGATDAGQQLPAVAMGLLGVVARSPAAVIAFPEVVEELLTHCSAETQREEVEARIAAAIAGLAQISETAVKIEESKLETK